jgi:2'-5' RNA ligase
MIRAFVALPVPPQTRSALARLQQSIPGGRLTDPDTLHVTLAFLGEQPEDRLEDLHYALESMRFPAFEIAIDGLGGFGRPALRTLHATIAPGRDLTALRKKIRSSARLAGIALGHERFVPHVTLARFPRHISEDDALRLDVFLTARAGLRLPEVPMTSVVLYRSTLGKDSARHDVLADYPLG